MKQVEGGKFVAQGTLINKHSINQTISRANLHGPVIASGVVRIFNFALVDGNYVEQGGRYRRSDDATHCATLNILSTKNSKDRVNGILFFATAPDIDSLADREYGYDLLPVKYEQEGKTAHAYMFIARQESKVIGSRVRDDILPNESSLKICMNGAATYGPDFLNMWVNSCYIANKTPLVGHPYYMGLVNELLRDSL